MASACARGSTCKHHSSRCPMPGASEDSTMEIIASPQGTAADQRQPPLPPRMNQRAASRALVATALLLGCAGSLPLAQAAGAASSKPPSLSRRSGEGVLRRSIWSPRKASNEERSLLAVTGPQRRGLPRLSSPWVVVQTTRGGGFRRRGGSGSAGVPAAGSGSSGDKHGEEGEASEGLVSAEASDGSGGTAGGEETSEKGSGEVSLRNDSRRWLRVHTTTSIVLLLVCCMTATVVCCLFSFRTYYRPLCTLHGLCCPITQYQYVAAVAAAAAAAATATTTVTAAAITIVAGVGYAGRSQQCLQTANQNMFFL